MNWQKSSYSADPDNNCVEVASHAGAVCVRESDEPDGVIPVSAAALGALVQLAKGRGLQPPRR